MVYLFVSLICWLIAANAVVQLPPAGLYFQLQSKATDIIEEITWSGATIGEVDLNPDDENLCITSNGDGDVLRDFCDDSVAKQFWTVYDLQSDNSFKLMNEKYGTCLFDKTSGNNIDFSVGECSSTGNKYYWKLNNPGNTWFRLKNKDSNKCISSNSMSDLSLEAKSCDTETERKWMFIYEDYNVVSVSLDVDNAQIVQGAPVAAAQGTCDATNSGSVATSVELSWSESRTSTASFEFSYGLEISVGTEFSTGVPGFGEASVSMDVTNSMQWTWGQEESETQTFTGSTTFSCAPGELIEGSAMLWANDYDIPYTMTLQSTHDPSFYFYSYGTYKKVDYYFFAVSQTCLSGCV